VGLRLKSLLRTSYFQVSFYQYVYDRVSAAHQIPNLADLITQRSRQMNLAASWDVT